MEDYSDEIYAYNVTFECKDDKTTFIETHESIGLDCTNPNDNAIKYANITINKFNKSLRSGETKREFIRIIAVDLCEEQ